MINQLLLTEQIYFFVGDLSYFVMSVFLAILVAFLTGLILLIVIMLFFIVFYSLKIIYRKTLNFLDFHFGNFQIRNLRHNQIRNFQNNQIRNFQGLRNRNPHTSSQQLGIPPMFL
jgi:sensor histidine kinase YesM